MKMDEFKVVYQDRILKINKCLAENGYKYKIEITTGLLSRSWEEYFSQDEEAMRSANQKFSNLASETGGRKRWLVNQNRRLNPQ
jgi:hypothetical protein